MRRTDVVERLQAPTRISSLPFLGVMPLVLIAWIGIPPSFMHGPVLPRARTAAPMLDVGVVLVVDLKGGFHLRGDDGFEHLAPSRLPSGLAEAYAGRPKDHVLHLWADEDATYSHVLTAVDAARHAGVQRVEIIVDPRAQDRIR